MKKILIVSHDAGGAEIISSWILHNPQNDYSYILEGPAIDIFYRKIPSLTYQKRTELVNSILECDFILTGTSWQSTLENEAIEQALTQDKKVVSYLEHWVNYKERFQWNNKLPNEIWVGDDKAKILAVEAFPQSTIKLVPNCYFADMKKEILSIEEEKPKLNGLNILYICEPVCDAAQWRFKNPNYFGYTEFEALDYFFACISKQIKRYPMNEITLRLHPSEPLDKYNKIIEKYSMYPVKISKQTPLVHDVAFSDWVVGCTSAALVVALNANKKTFCSIPIELPKYKLPFEEIVDFKFAKY